MIDRYANRRGPIAAPRGPAFDVNEPVAGCYRIRLRKGGPPVGLRIWLGFSIDPATGAEVEERSPTWQCAVNNGERVPVERHWPHCARDPISRAEHDRLAAEARTMNEHSPFFDARKPVDLLRAQLPF